MATLNIGLTAYYAVGNLVFVRVPSERGRYLLTDMCVIVVECPFCKATVGEPCRGGNFSQYGQPQRVRYHGCSAHIGRKALADQRFGRNWKQRVVSTLKLRLAVGDVIAAMADGDEYHESAPFEIDVPVTMKENL